MAPPTFPPLSASRYLKFRVVFFATAAILRILQYFPHFSTDSDIILNAHFPSLPAANPNDFFEKRIDAADAVRKTIAG